MASHTTPRRQFMAALLASSLPSMAWPLPPAQLRFPRDLGSHPDFGTEWWYITGRVMAAAGGGAAREFGFQLTFFRSRVDATQSMTSAFAARQLLFAHAALTDVQGAKLWHDQRIARAGFGVAEASESDTRLRLRDWSLRREDVATAAEGPVSTYTAVLPAQDFGLQLSLAATQPLLLQGRQGLSRKGPQPEQASYYVSQPQLAVSGAVILQGRRFDITEGRAWLDHEWSQALLHPEAVGWDWIGMNLEDGSALTAFHLRRADGSALWDGGSYRHADGRLRSFEPNDVVFEAVRHWTSAASQARYPVEWRVRTPAGAFTVRAVVEDQELDSRASTGAIYWEGLSELRDVAGTLVGRGYLEMTGYAKRLTL
ncbi:MAG: carotenoid 1,2-hydratase [Rhodoferax sp.]|nr:carotenoid 1,2-hydratase [Rhodoferax sp.]